MIYTSGIIHNIIYSIHHNDLIIYTYILYNDIIHHTHILSTYIKTTAKTTGAEEAERRHPAIGRPRRVPGIRPRRPRNV
jgi:hypothetical protein